MEIKLNLLSEAKKTEIAKKKRYQLIVLHQCIYIFMILFYGIILGSLYTMHSLQIKHQEALNATASEEVKIKEIIDAQAEFTTANKKIDDALRFQKEHIVWSGMFHALQDARPEGVYIEKLVTTERKVALVGRAETRDILLDFQNKLNETGCFVDAKVPLADLFTQEDVSFQLDFEVKKECLKPGTI